MTVISPERNGLYEHHLEDVEAPISVCELEDDVIARQRAAEFIGACATRTEVDLDRSVEQFSQNESLYHALQRAKEGDRVARSMVETNVRTDVVERTIKAGHITEVTLNVDEAGKIQQNGQSMESIQANSLRFAAHDPRMRRRVEAEATNSFRLQQLYESGALEDYSFVVFSCAADDMPEAAMKKAGFFTDTMSCAIQVTSAQGNQIKTESAFVAGVKQPGAKRHDIDTVHAIAERFGADFSGMSATEILNSPILVPNTMLENGVADIVKAWDTHLGDTFFGEYKEKQDYTIYREQCREREAILRPKVNLITQELISMADSVHDRVSATELLGEISGKHMIQQAVFDKAVNPEVFGTVSAGYIYQARREFEAGNIAQVLGLTDKAIQNDMSTSCPGGASGSAEKSSSSHDSETCTFVSKKCPKCGTKNVLTTVTAKRISGSCGCSSKVSKNS